MAVFPPSAARGYISKKDGIGYDETSASFVDGIKDKTVITVNTPKKQYTLEGVFTPPNNPTGEMICGGGKWNFTILGEK